jgi:hypothetical protein
MLRNWILFEDKLTVRVKRSLVDIYILEVLIRGRICDAKVIEDFGPVSFKVELGNAVFMRNEKISVWVKEADAVHWVWQLDFSKEFLITVPNPYCTFCVGCHK